MLQIQPVEGRRSSVDLCMKDKSIFVNKKLEKNILLYAFYLITWFMKTAKNFEK